MLMNISGKFHNSFEINSRIEDLQPYMTQKTQPLEG